VSDAAVHAPTPAWQSAPAQQSWFAAPHAAHVVVALSQTNGSPQ
jgi:hypothetical protein